MGAAVSALAAGAARAQAPPTAPFEDRLAQAALANRHRLAFDGTTFSGPAWDLLVREGSAAQFFLLGEEHGIAENPKLAGALFAALRPAGYRRFGIEISAPMAEDLDRAAATGGFPALAARLNTEGSQAAFFTMREEAQMLAAVRAAAPKGEAVLWGVDYEVGADRRLIELLEAAAKPAAARAPVAALRQASAASWAKYGATRSPLDILSFSGDPALIAAVRATWPAPDARSAWILDTLKETFEINGLYAARQGFESNRRRASFIRANFLRHWALEAGRKPKAMFKMGSNHLVRGRSSVETFDLGSLLPEAAALVGGHSFSMMVLPGAERQAAVFNASTWRYAPDEPKDHYNEGLDPFVKAAWPDAFTLFDLRPIRNLFSASRARTVHPELMRTVHGFDTLLVMSGSTPSANL